MSSRASPAEECPFDGFDRLARTPYLVLPKLAIQAMPIEWRKRLDALLSEAEESGLNCPAYHVLRSDEDYTVEEVQDSEDEFSGTLSLTVLRADPWANYRHGDAWLLSKNDSQ